MPSSSSNFAVIPSSFRTFLAYMDLSYVFIMALQRYLNGQFPSQRFDSFRSVIMVHLATGMIILYSGTWLQFTDAKDPMTAIDDLNPSWQRRIIYIFMALAAIVHSATVIKTSSKVMGEKRITYPLYLCAGFVNFFNGINLLFQQNLGNAFLLWGSINVFILVRLNILALLLAKVDWELAYTYSIVAAAGVVYPMTGQYKFVYVGAFLPLVYAPLHERFCAYNGWPTEDTLGGNAPTVKNVDTTTRDLRKKLGLSVVPSTANKLGIITEEEGANGGEQDDESLEEFLPSEKTPLNNDKVGNGRKFENKARMSVLNASTIYFTKLSEN